MAKHRVAFLGSGNSDVGLVKEGLKGLDCDLTVHTTSSDGETIEAIKGADVIILNAGKMPRQVIEEIDTAKAIISGGHGFDPIDDGAATEKGIMVINSAGFCTEEVSNHVMMLLLACAKKLTMLDGLMKAGSWGSQDRGANSTQTGRGASMPAVYGQTLGLIALGNIGRATARKAKVFGLEVIAYDPYVPEWTARECGVELVSSLNELASRSDFVSLHTPLNNENQETRRRVVLQGHETLGLLHQHFARRDGGRAGAHSSAAERRDRGCGAGCIRTGADARRQPPAEDGQRHSDATYCRQLSRLD